MSLSNPNANWEVKLPADYTKLTWQQRGQVRREYSKLQNHMCMFCKASLFGEPSLRAKQFKVNWDLFPPEFLKYPVHLQHNHETNMTEGVAHALCNAVAWQYLGR